MRTPDVRCISEVSSLGSGYHKGYPSFSKRRSFAYISDVLSVQDIVYEEYVFIVVLVLVVVKTLRILGPPIRVHIATSTICEHSVICEPFVAINTRPTCQVPDIIHA
jgi:hypothetical protein